MTAEPRYRRQFSFNFPTRDSRRQRNSLPDFTHEYEPILVPDSSSSFAMPTIVPRSKVTKKIWDSDKALQSTHDGLFGKHQLRAYLLLALGYAVIGGWLAKMPAFALLPPKYINCTPYYPNHSNFTYPIFIQLNKTTSIDLNGNTTELIFYARNIKPQLVYNYSEEYGRSALTDFDTLCDRTRLKTPYIIYIIGLILGGLVFGYMADLSGRKMILLGSLWTACSISIFQLLSEDYISYAFFMLFLGLTIGAVHVIAIPVVMEMFPIKTRVIYALGLLGAVFLLDLVIPWLALAIKNWKILQAIISAPLILTSILYWFMEESMFWHTAQKDYAAAVLSLTKIASYNGVVFDNLFDKASEFLHSKTSKSIQCDIHPLSSLENIRLWGPTYPDVDMVEFQKERSKENTLSKRLWNILNGSNYHSELSMFYPTDFLHSFLLNIYVAVLCGLWLVSSLTEYGLDAPQLTEHLTESFHANYFYTHLVQIISFIIAFPLVYIWGRRWPTFCFFLIAEVCLLGSAAVRLDSEQTRVGMLLVYFTGKFATRAAFIILVIYTCEISPTGLRCTILGICYTFRLIGVALASPDVGEVNGRMPRLIYGVLSLILGSLALLLPETKILPLPRTILQVENMKTSLSKMIHRRQCAKILINNVQSDLSKPAVQNNFNDATNSIMSGLRSGREYDYQSTMHSIVELQDYSNYDTTTVNRQTGYGRRMDPQSSIYFPAHSPMNSDKFRYPHTIDEAVEYTNDVDNDQAGLALRHRLQDKKQLAALENPILPPVQFIPLSIVKENTSSGRQSSLDSGSRNRMEEVPADQTEATDEKTESNNQDEKKESNNQDEKYSSSPKYQRTMSQDENYFSEHC